MEQPVVQPCYCDFRLCGKKRKNTLYEYSNNENIPYLFKILIKVYITALQRFCMFSNLFDSQGVGTPIINK